MKKFVLFLFVVSVFVSCFSGCGGSCYTPEENPASDFKYSIIDDDGEEGISVDRYVGTRRDVIVPAYIDGKPVVETGGAFIYNKSITSVVLPDTLLTIGFSCFKGCADLKTVTLGNNVEYIGMSAFEDCPSLQNVTFPSTLRSIGANAFENCDSLTRVELPDSLYSMDSNAFAYCDSLEEVTVPGNLSHLDGYAFARCTSLTKISVKSGIDMITYPFHEIPIESVTFPASVIVIMRGFWDCPNLTSIRFTGDIPRIDFYLVYEEEQRANITIYYPSGATGTDQEALQGFRMIPY